VCGDLQVMEYIYSGATIFSYVNYPACTCVDWGCAYGSVHFPVI